MHSETELPLASPDAATLPLLALRPDDLAAFLEGRTAPERAWLESQRFTAAAQELVLLPGPAGVAGAVLGLGRDTTPHAYGGLAARLPAGTAWRLEGPHDIATATLGFCLGGYHFAAFRPAKRGFARLAAPEGGAEALELARACFLARDLINTPANLLGPAELADAAQAVAARFGAPSQRIEGADIDAGYPAIAAVGRGSARPPVVVAITWRGSAADDSSPLVSLCGKGVVFDTGGYDLKPSAGMLRMKKDMGGAATVLGIARELMRRDAPIRLAVRVGCVENSVSGSAMRPSDVIATRKGLSVEIGNTDAEGRLVLADLLAAAAEEAPDLLLDCATLTGAARVALGPDIPALFCSDETFLTRLLRAGREVGDPVWPLPLWDGYDPWLDSPLADLNNVSAKPFAGAIIGALFLRRFVPPTTTWAHLDLYAWNDSDRPGRPEGGEAQALRAICRAIDEHIVMLQGTRNNSVM
jgi:leucyl aminopeptidase